MDIYDEDLLRFWEYLSRYKVRYIMIGGLQFVSMDITEILKIFTFGWRIQLTTERN